MMIAPMRMRWVSVSTVARWLNVKPHTVLAWIRLPDETRLPALDVGTRGSRPSYRIYRSDLITFLEARGLTPGRIAELLGEKVVP